MTRRLSFVDDAFDERRWKTRPDAAAAVIDVVARRRLAASSTSPLAPSAPPKIALLMIDNRAFDVDQTGRWRNFWLYTAMINLMYAQRHGYAFYALRCDAHYGARMHGRAPQWCRLHALRDLLLRYDYVLYMDTDAHWNPTAFETPLSDVIREHRLDDAAQQRMLLVPIEWAGGPRGSDRSCTGILLMRNVTTYDSSGASFSTLAFLDEWWHSPDTVNRTRYDKYKYEWEYEQKLMTDVMMPRYASRIATTRASQHALSHAQRVSRAPLP